MAGETYTRAYSGGWLDQPSISTPVTAAKLNAMEDALVRLLGEDPADGEIPAWSASSGRFVFRVLTSSDIPTLAVTKLTGGTDTQVLTTSGTTPTWAALTSAQIPTLAVTKLTGGSDTQVLSTSGSTPTWAALTSAQIPTLAVTKLSPGSDTQVLGTSGSTPTWASLTAAQIPTLAVTKLSPGSDTQVLSTSGSTPTWAALTAAQMPSSIAVSKLAAGTDTQVLSTSGSTPTWGSLAAAQIPSGLAVTKLVAGTSNQVLSMSGSTVTWQALATAQLPTSIPVANLAAGSDTQVLKTSGSSVVWGSAGSSGNTTYRKTSEKDVVNTVTETDLLNGEVTVAANAMSTDRVARCVLAGDYLNNSGADRALVLAVKFGGTTAWKGTVLNATSGGVISASANRRAWRLVFEVAELGATNSQFVTGVFNMGTAVNPTTGISDTQSTSVTAAAFATTSALVAPFASNGTLSVDTTASCALVVTCTHPTNHASLSMRLKYALVELA